MPDTASAYRNETKRHKTQKHPSGPSSKLRIELSWASACRRDQAERSFRRQLWETVEASIPCNAPVHFQNHPNPPTEIKTNSSNQFQPLHYQPNPRRKCIRPLLKGVSRRPPKSLVSKVTVHQSRSRQKIQFFMSARVLINTHVLAQAPAQPSVHTQW